jgi:sRNA-binding regulator protein Hfq
MSDSSAIPVRRVFDARLVKPKAKADGANPSPMPSISPSGPRKLVRPPMPGGAFANRGPLRVSPLSSNYRAQNHAAVRSESSHAEAFYFQKQIHSQTLMVFVLEDGEQIEGQIEWYDRDSIKVRSGATRTLLYKPGIKYLFKASEKTPAR